MQSTLRRLSSIGAAIVVLVSGCVDSPAELDHPTQRQDDVASAQVYTGATPSDDRLSPLNVTVSAGSPIALKQPMSLQVDLVAELQGTYDVALYSPDIERAASVGWRGNPRLTRKFQTLSKQQVVLSKGARRSIKLPLIVEAAGSYEITVVVTRVPEDGPVPPHYSQQQFLTKVLQVTETVGELRDGMEPAAVPPGYIPSRGVYTPTRPERDKVGLRSTGCPAGHVCGNLLYDDLTSGFIETRAVGPGTLWYVHNMSVYTAYVDQAGFFALPCATSNWLGTPEIVLSDQAAGVSIDNALTILIVGCGIYEKETPDYYMNGATANYYMQLRTAAVRSRAMYGHSASVTAHVGPGDSHFDPDNHRIYLNDDYAFSRARFTVGHEYGHLLMFDVLDAEPTNWDTCANPHNPSDASTFGCAYSEGFATAHALDVWAQDLLGGGENDRGDYYYYENGLPDHVAGADGAIVEGDVARYLVDLVDSSSDYFLSGDFDNVDISSTSFANNVRSCEVLRTSWGHATGIDHLHYCLEDTVSPLISQVYFFTRPQPTQQRSTADGFASLIPDIRKIMRWNLYANER